MDLFAAIRAAQFIGLALLLGGPAYWTLVWRGADFLAEPQVAQAVWHRIRAGVGVGAVLFVVAAGLDLLYVARTVIDVTDWPSLRLYLERTRHGSMTLWKLSLAPALALSFAAGRGRWRVVAAPLTGLCVLALPPTISLASHAAAQPGWLPVVSDAVHLLAAGVWGGGVLHFALLPWRALDGLRRPALVGGLVRRFSNVALGAVVALAATGLLAGFLHVYSPLQLTTTPYGRTLLVKVGLWLGVLALGALHLLVIGPTLKAGGGGAERWVARFPTLLRLEAALLAAVLAMGGDADHVAPGGNAGPGGAAHLAASAGGRSGGHGHDAHGRALGAVSGHLPGGFGPRRRRAAVAAAADAGSQHGPVHGGAAAGGTPAFFGAGAGEHGGALGGPFESAAAGRDGAGRGQRAL